MLLLEGSNIIYQRRGRFAKQGKSIAVQFFLCPVIPTFGNLSECQLLDSESLDSNLTLKASLFNTICSER